MIIGERLRALREEKKLSQGDIEKKTGLLRCYVSRVENGHTVPAVETLEKFARALEVPMYQLFYDGEEPPKLPNLLKRSLRKIYCGAVLARMLICLPSSAACSVGWKKMTGTCYFSWLRRWRSRRPFKRKCLEVGHSDIRGSRRLPISVGGENDLPERPSTNL